MNLLEEIATKTPLRNRLSSALATGCYLAAFNPLSSASTYVLEDIRRFSIWAPFYPELLSAAEWGLFTASGLCLPYLAAKMYYPSGKSKPKGAIVIGDMEFGEKSLFTNVMITGAIGSGKTSSAIYPMLDQLLQIYSHEDIQTTVDDPFQKLGGLVLDVKGDFYEALVYLMYEAGRNVLEDLVVITPHYDYPYIEFQDPETGYYFYVSARGGGEEASNELAALLAGYHMPDPATGRPNPRQPIDSTSLLEENVMDHPISATVPMTFRQYVEGLEFDVSSKFIRYLGWREEGGQLRRILRTTQMKPEVVEYAADEHGNPIRVQKPKRLRFKAVRYVSNGLTFNICPPSLSPTEMANRLVSMSKTASGKGGGDNAFWDDATKKHIGWVVQMWRTVNPKVEISAIDINHLTSDQTHIDVEVGKLKALIKAKEARMKACTDPVETRMISEELPILKDMLNYFDGEWATLDMKTKSNLISCITNLFGQFMSEKKLRATFCQPSSFSMETIMQNGKIFTMVAPGYEGAAKVFGTSLKMEFQALLKRRLAQANYNKTRLVLHCCDEAQNYVTAGGADNSGDENFMALSRQSRVANIIATQSDSSIINVIGEKSAPVYFQSFGCRIWYQNLDEKTNKSAAFVLGKVRREKRSRQGQEFQVSTVLTKDSSAKGYSETINSEKDDRYPPELFASLNVHEAIMYDKNKPGVRDKSCRNKLQPHPIGSKAGTARKHAVVRHYFQAFIENRKYTLRESSALDHIKPAPVAPAASAPGTAPLPASPTAPTPPPLSAPPTPSAPPGLSAPTGLPPPSLPGGMPAPTAPPPPAHPNKDAIKEWSWESASAGAAPPSLPPPTRPPEPSFPPPMPAPPGGPAASVPSLPAPLPDAEGGIDDLWSKDTERAHAQRGEDPKPAHDSALPPPDVVSRPPEEEVSEKDLKAIQQTYGDSSAIENKLKPFVQIIDRFGGLGVPYDASQPFDANHTATGSQLTESSGGHCHDPEQDNTPSMDELMSDALAGAAATPPANPPAPAATPKPEPTPAATPGPVPTGTAAPHDPESLEDALRDLLAPPTNPVPANSDDVVRTEGEEDSMDSLR